MQVMTIGLQIKCLRRNDAAMKTDARICIVFFNISCVLKINSNAAEKGSCLRVKTIIYTAAHFGIEAGIIGYC